MVVMRPCLAACLLLVAALPLPAQALRAGYARREITPREPTPLWGYADRHDALSTGARDPLYADVLVLDSGQTRLALVGLDLGRSPDETALQAIRKRLLDRSAVNASIIAASHTHHAPVMEFHDEPGKGQGKFDATLRWYRQLEDSIVEAVAEAASRLEPVQLAAGASPLQNRNRNRHTKKDVKPVDPDLTVLRFDTSSAKPLCTVVHFTAHPTSLPSSDLRFSADYVGALKSALARQTGAGVLFLQGAEGDQSADRGQLDYAAFGEALAGEAFRLSSSLKPLAAQPAKLQVKEDRFHFDARINIAHPFIRGAFTKAFFPELVANYVDEYAGGVRPRLTVARLGDAVSLVAVSGEVFSAHALRLRERAPAGLTLLCGLANGYHQYFPTIEAMAEGGYGAAASESPAAPGAGESLMNTALIWLYQMTGKLN
jgi:hypothetical protein